MTTTVMSFAASTIRLPDLIEYPRTGIQSKILLEDAHCRYTLMLIAAETSLAEHASLRNATIHVLEGQGVLTLEGKDIVLEPGVFVFMPSQSRHAIKSEKNLAFLLTLSEKAGERSGTVIPLE
jgi:quercetin dioxygenase-like cupin family protein